MSSSPFPVSRRTVVTAGSTGAAATFGLLRFAPAASATAPTTHKQKRGPKTLTPSR